MERKSQKVGTIHLMWFSQTNFFFLKKRCVTPLSNNISLNWVILASSGTIALSLAARSSASMAASFSESASFVSSFLQVLKTEVVVRESFFLKINESKRERKKRIFHRDRTYFLFLALVGSSSWFSSAAMDSSGSSLLTPVCEHRHNTNIVSTESQEWLQHLCFF